jgi:hypothetical protein
MSTAIALRWCHRVRESRVDDVEVKPRDSLTGKEF